MALKGRRRIGRTTQLGYPYWGRGEARVSMGMGMGTPKERVLFRKQRLEEAVF